MMLPLMSACGTRTHRAEDDARGDFSDWDTGSGRVRNCEAALPIRYKNTTRFYLRENLIEELRLEHRSARRISDVFAYAGFGFHSAHLQLSALAPQFTELLY
jgi:hypothetical protein